MEKTIKNEDVNEFKNMLAGWLMDLSICFSSELRKQEDGSFTMGMPIEQIKIMVDTIVRLIIANKMTFEPEPYSNSIRMIASGDTDISRLNVVNLMRIFKEEHQRYLNHKRPEKW